MADGLLPKSMRRVYRAGSPFSDAAAAAGPAVLAGANAPSEEVTHETRHAEQFRVPGFPIAKILEMLYPYGTGPLEQDAYRKEGMSPAGMAELQKQARKDSPIRAAITDNPLGRGYANTAQSYIRALLGD